MKILDLYTDYLISQNKYATSTGLSSLLEGSISHDKITRFLNREELSAHLTHMMILSNYLALIKQLG